MNTIILNHVSSCGGWEIWFQKKLVTTFTPCLGHSFLIEEELFELRNHGFQSVFLTIVGRDTMEIDIRYRWPMDLSPGAVTDHIQTMKRCGFVRKDTTDEKKLIELLIDNAGR